MKILYHKQSIHSIPVGEDFEKVSIQKSLENLRDRLEIAYCGFDNVTEPELIDSYIYEINSILQQYNFLTKEAETKLNLPLTMQKYLFRFKKNSAVFQIIYGGLQKEKLLKIQQKKWLYLLRYPTKYQKT